MGIDIRDWIEVNPYDDLRMCGCAHVDMWHACVSVIHCEGLYTVQECGYTDGVMTYLGQVQQNGGSCQQP